MSHPKQHALGPFGTVYATRAEVHERDRNHQDTPRVTHSVYLDTRVPGERYDEYPGLRVNGIEYHLSAQALRWEWEGGSGIRLSSYLLRRRGTGADATRNASSAVYAAALALVGRLCADPLWCAETDVELAEEGCEKAREGVERAQEALREAQSELRLRQGARADARAALEWLRTKT